MLMSIMSVLTVTYRPKRFHYVDLDSRLESRSRPKIKNFWVRQLFLLELFVASELNFKTNYKLTT